LAPACSSSDPTGAGNGELTFNTSVSGNESIGSLSAGERSTLCDDQTRFGSSPSVKADGCRFRAAISASVRAGFSSGTTDAELRAMCSESYDECMNTPSGGGGGAKDDPSAGCNGPPVGTCTATVSELGTCLEDTVAALHALAGALPDCTTIGADKLSAPPGIGTPALETLQPKSCDTLIAKCPGISDDARAFADEYCALIEPCCASAGLGSRCTLTVYAAAKGATFDQSAAAACLDRLHQRQAGADFCDSLESGQMTSQWAAIPDCDAAFVGSGGRQAVQAGPAPTDLLPSTAAVGDPCVGTTGTELDSNGSGTWTSFVSGTTEQPTEGVVCDHDQGLVCDDQTHVCRAGDPAGAPCSTFDACGAGNYCDFSAHACAPRLEPGAACAGNLMNECVPGAYCDASTLKCAVPEGPGAACSETPAASANQCRSGICDGGVCASRLAPLCGK
jgi:hypothetical protein